ncbi:MAG TPA: cytochrome c oxidase subunit II transmembrane domain-containing protein, partial [Brevundimonas sp.]|nr:cytochrome c oxidase subunit II transmembrane domain-containing protein [Brevundimonas sp.]
MGTRAPGLIGSGMAALALALFAAAPAAAQELVGQPTDGALGLQPAASPLKVEAHFFHDAILMPIITFICLLVLGLIVWIVIRYNKKSNPVPAKWSHNTLVEVIW